jgi:hypothetical protein
MMEVHTLRNQIWKFYIQIFWHYFCEVLNNPGISVHLRTSWQLATTKFISTLFLVYIVKKLRLVSSGTWPVLSGRNLLTIWRNILTPFSGLKSKPSKQPTRCILQAKWAMCGERGSHIGFARNLERTKHEQEDVLIIWTSRPWWSRHQLITSHPATNKQYPFHQIHIHGLHQKMGNWAPSQ